ncbi:MAG TPA: ferredoxin [Alphaproteobacteria bacterium]|nr:ferredoxin [Alphaproteobacteria bacterium]
MQGGPQAYAAFYLTGKRAGGELGAIDGLDLRPALFAAYRDLTKLRYDFPLVLLAAGADEGPVQSLSGLFDKALHEIAQGADGERLRRHALRLEQEIRRLVAEGEGGTLSLLSEAAASRLATKKDDLLQDSLARVRAALKADGEVVDCDQVMPEHFLKHAWKTVQEKKSRAFRAELDRLAVKLSDILKADFVRSEEGRSAASLKAAIGPAHAAAFDFNAMSRLLGKTAGKAALSESRRQRIRWLLSVLESQKFFARSGGAGKDGEAEAPYSFVFASCAAALEAYRERQPRMIELAKAIAIAELEIEGEYHEARHDSFFADFGASGLDPRDTALFPDYLVSLNAAHMTPEETSKLPEVLSAGLPMKILVQSDDILEPSPAGDGHASLGSRGRLIARSMIGSGEVYVLQSSASHLFRFRDRVICGLAYNGPALFSIFSGATGNAGDLPAYLMAAAAMESRAFAAFVYDPSAGPDWASRFHLEDNPQPELDWPVHSLAFEDEAHQRVPERLAFTLVDFLACDRRLAKDFARVPRAEWNGRTVPVPECLAHAPNGLPEKLPSLYMVDRDNMLQKVIVGSTLVREARRCAEMWRSLQELGGIHNSHAERLLAKERAAWQEQQKREAEARGSASVQVKETPAAVPGAPAPAPAPAPQQAEAEAEPPSDEPYIETPRCNSCNECIQINGKMFAYNKDKQASIVDPTAGTYRQLVEAAESCQVSIIHPGKPRDPNEPGIEELIARAEPFR